MNYLEPHHYEIAEKNGIPRDTAYSRFYKKGWTVERAITQPIMKRSDHGWSKWKDVAKVSKDTYMQRVRDRGWDQERAALTPSYRKKKFKRAGYRVFTEEQEEKMKKNGIDRITAYMRVHKLGWTKEDAVTIPLVDREESLKRARMNSPWNKTKFLFGKAVRQ